MKKNYSDSDPLYAIERGYNKKTRMLMFHSTDINADQLQEALDIIKKYNGFESKTVGKVLLEKFKNCRFVVGREHSVVVYVIPTTSYLFWVETLQKVQEEARVDEVAVNERGELRLWWD